MKTNDKIELITKIRHKLSEEFDEYLKAKQELDAHKKFIDFKMHKLEKLDTYLIELSNIEFEKINPDRKKQIS